VHRIASDRAEDIGYPVPDHDIPHGGADGSHAASTLEAEAAWQRDRYGAVPLRHVQIVDAYRRHRQVKRALS
jgi:hypothetical protein